MVCGGAPHDPSLRVVGGEPSACVLGYEEHERAARRRPVRDDVPAATYSPTQSPRQYHRRGRALLPGSGWDRVFPLRHGHRNGGLAEDDLRERLRGCELRVTSERDSEREQESSPRPISTGQLHTSPCFHFRPINLVVCEGPYPVDPVGDLISRRASHLDAFSAYPCRTWLTSRAAGATTGTPEVRPPRSSRTRGSSSQISYAHSG
jgi:hypothetical protein